MSRSAAGGPTPFESRSEASSTQAPHGDGALRVDVVGVDRSALVALSGELDMLSAPKVREVLLGLLGAGAHFLFVDLAELGFIDMTGAGVLVAACKRARAAGGDVVLVSVPDNVLRVLRIAQLDRIFRIEPGKLAA